MFRNAVKTTVLLASLGGLLVLISLDRSARSSACCSVLSWSLGVTGSPTSWPFELRGAARSTMGSCPGWRSISPSWRSGLVSPFPAYTFP